MPHITTCTTCTRCYEESSEETANAADRLCPSCWQIAARKRLAAKPVAEHVRNQDAPSDPEEAHERRIKRCRSCNAQIIWFETTGGRKMPVDAATVEPDDQEYRHGIHVSHFVTCPEANQHRRAR